ncbi:MAG TPA: hypothetical protein VMU19_03735 [Bryobacteraceae bacterium]|nr:hypothetical protein [Bryobacteraceae bacterium]
MFHRIVFLALLGVALAAAKTYTFDIDSATQAGTTLLKPGQYSMKVDGSQAVLRDQNGRTFTASVKVQSGTEKFNQTIVSTSTAGGKDHIESIELGGTTNKVVFE